MSSVVVAQAEMFERKDDATAEDAGGGGDDRCARPACAGVYERMLGWLLVNEDAADPGDPPEDVWAQLCPPPGETGPTLNFEFERHYVPPVWPSVVGEQHITEHLDIAVDDLNETVAWAVAAGATLADYQPQDDVRVLFDPAGHPFCLFLI